MKIAIYEIIHLDWLVPLCELFDGLPYEVHFFTLLRFEKDLHEALPGCYEKYRWTYLEESESQRAFFTKAKNFFESTRFDMVILNSVDEKHALLYYLLRHHSEPVVMNLHDVNNFFLRKYSFSLRQVVRSFGKRLLDQKISAFLVNFVEMKNYILNERLTKKPIYVLPPVFSKASLKENYENNLSVVVPGSIDLRRRDYDVVLEAWEALENKGAILIFAGCPKSTYGDEIIKKARRLIDKGYSLQFFDKEIPEEIFQKIIADATFILSPLCIITSIHDGIIEEYGLSKTSGNIYDAIRHGKPMIIPKGLRLPNTIESSCLYFSNVIELKEIMTNLLNSKEALKDVSNAAYINSLKYNIDTIRNKLVYFIDNITENENITT